MYVLLGGLIGLRNCEVGRGGGWRKGEWGEGRDGGGKDKPDMFCSRVEQGVLTYSDSGTNLF